MNIDEIIKGRRTVKKFFSRSVTFEKILKILDAADHAPSAGNSQNWRFIIITDKKTKKSLVSICDNQKLIEESPVVIAVFSDNLKLKTLFGDKADFYGIQNCAAAIQNMLLKAHDLGLGSTWIGKFNEEKLKEILNVEFQDPQALVCIGYPERTNKLEREPLNYKIFYEKWGNKIRDTNLWPVSKYIPKVSNQVKEFIDLRIKRESNSK